MKHGIPRPDQIYAIAFANYSARLDLKEVELVDVWLYIGHPHSQTEREIEVLVRVYDDGREAVVFHAMNLGPKFATYRAEHHYDE